LLYNTSKLYNIPLEERIIEMLINEKVAILSHTEIIESGRDSTDLPYNYELISTLLGLGYYTNPEIADLFFGNGDYHRIADEIKHFTYNHLATDFSPS